MKLIWNAFLLNNKDGAASRDDAIVKATEIIRNSAIDECFAVGVHEDGHPGAFVCMTFNGLCSKKNAILIGNLPGIMALLETFRGLCLRLPQIARDELADEAVEFANKELKAIDFYLSLQEGTSLLIAPPRATAEDLCHTTQPTAISPP